MTFQTRLNDQNPLAVEGDFASANPHASTIAGEGGFIAGPEGVTIGRFAWIDVDGKTVHNYATNTAHPDGFVHRDAQALITAYLANASMVIPAGFPVALMREGDFFAKVAGSTAAVRDGAIYADRTSGAINLALPTSASATGSIGSTNTATLGSTFTATGTGTTLAVSAITGYLSVGDTISGTGVPAGTTIVAQLTGTTGAAGNYQTSVATTASAATVTSFGAVLNVTSTTGYISVNDNVAGVTGLTGARIASQLTGTAGSTGLYKLTVPGTAYVASGSGVTTYGNVLAVTAVASGALALGDEIQGTGVPAGAVIATQVNGTTGGVGNYTITIAPNAYVASTSLTGVVGVATNWYAQSAAAVGELVKISTWGK
jgi:hypothetical protein